LKRKSDQNKVINKLLKNKIVLITGGAGSVGSVLAEKILEYPVKVVRVLDSNEHALFTLKRSLKDSRLRLLLGNILDKDRIEMASNDVDIIIHAAAAKNIEITEFNAIDTIDININGTVNMVKTAIKTKPKMFLNISTDKVAESSTLYGTTKEIGERLTTWAAKHIETTQFASVRFGNVMETKGNVFEVWQKEVSEKKPISITDPNMKRYFFHIEEAVDFILECMTNIQQGTVFIPKMKSYKIKELADKVSKKQKIIGLRPGEKLEEILMTKDEIKKAVNKKNYWVLK
jgi:UDP-N-acetylglucosamine 4,6-dehydratase/5-epimerase